MSKQDKLNNIENKFSSLEEQVKELEKLEKELENKNSKLAANPSLAEVQDKNKADNLQKKVEELESKAKKLEQENLNLKSSNDKLQTQGEYSLREEFSEILVNYETQIAQLHSELNADRETIETLKAENQSLSQQIEFSEQKVSQMSKEDIADVLINAKIQAKGIINRAEQDAKNIVADAENRLEFLKEEGNQYWTRLREISKENEEFISRLLERANGLEK